jgi:putative phosphoribosyl transferase
VGRRKTYQTSILFVARTRDTIKLFDASKISDILSGKERLLHLNFKDRVGAGVVLGNVLRFTVKKKGKDDRILVLGIPRGGVIVADIVARKLNADFDIVIPRKLTAPDNKENAIGAIMEDGSLYLDDFLVNSLRVSQEYIEKEKQEQLQEIERRKGLYRPTLNQYINTIKDRIVVLVDDGIATGATVIAAARWIRKRQPRQLIIAAPVAQPQAADLLKTKGQADMVEIISTPSNFASVNQFYQNFDQVTDERVIEILKNRKFLS